MAHVKCNYQRWVCTAKDQFDVTGDCFSCKAEFYSEDGNCPSLELRPSFIEKNSKSVDFDGEDLYVGGKYIASADWDDSPTTYDGYINYLEIDGEVIIKDGEIMEEKA